jgi:cytochrome c peroxidase
MVVRLVADAYRRQYEAIFGPMADLSGLPEHAMPEGTPVATAAWKSIPSTRQSEINLAYANIGKAIAAFERTITTQPTRFDAFASALASGKKTEADSILSERERAGLKLFIGQANCVSCHNGPLLTDNAFHNLALPNTSLASDEGRSAAVAKVKVDSFNCLGSFSDARPLACTELKFMETSGPDLVGGFRSPSLRGVALRPPYMHKGQFATLHDVLTHYNQAPAASFGKSELKPLRLTERELSDLEAFLRTLDPQ